MILDYLICGCDHFNLVGVVYRLLLEEEEKAGVHSQLEQMKKKEKELQGALQELGRENEKLQVHV